MKTTNLSPMPPGRVDDQGQPLNTEKSMRVGQHRVVTLQGGVQIVLKDFVKDKKPGQSASDAEVDDNKVPQWLQFVDGHLAGAVDGYTDHPHTLLSTPMGTGDIDAALLDLANGIHSSQDFDSTTLFTAGTVERGTPQEAQGIQYAQAEAVAHIATDAGAGAGAGAAGAGAQAVAVAQPVSGALQLVEAGAGAVAAGGSGTGTAAAGSGTASAAAVGTSKVSALPTTSPKTPPVDPPISAPVDTTPPGAPNLVLASDTGSDPSDGVTNVSTINITGLEQGATWSYSIDGGSTQTTGTGTSLNAVDGTHTYTVTQTDAAGNQSQSSSLVVTLDQTAPQINVARGSYWNLILNFNEPIDTHGHQPEPGDFSLSDNAVWRVFVSDNDVFLAMSHKPLTADIPASAGLFYHPSHPDNLHDLAGNIVSPGSIAGYPITNVYVPGYAFAAI